MERMTEEKLQWSDVFRYGGGELFWVSPTGRRAKPGDVAGCARPDGYRMVGVNGKSHLCHRVIWEMHNGPIPEGAHIDHIDGNPSNNRIENLRLCSHSQNAQNSRLRTGGSSKWKGVCWVSGRGKWMASINKVFIGHFDCEADAAQAYNLAAVKLFGAFARENEA